ncbi:MAG: HNH endonuclease signature motif containing protein [Marmoricola sp.]
MASRPTPDPHDNPHHLTPTQLRHAGKHLLEVIAPDLADELIARQLEADEQAAYPKVRLSLRDNGDGTTAGYFRLPDLKAAMLKNAVEAIIAPRKLGADRIDPATGKRIDYNTLLGQGFAELIEHLPVDELPRHGRVPVTLLELDPRLASALGAAGFGDGDRLSPEQVRRLAGNAGIIPVLYGAPSVAIDRGRETRLFTEAQSVLMAIRDHGCRAETGDRPPSWCEAHHYGTTWSQGGRTDLADGVLLCAFHHRLAHHATYDHQRLPNGDVRFTRRC